MRLIDNTQLKTVYLDSLGCAKNLVDSENILGNFKECGYQITLNPALADIIIVNTCGFIHAAREESIDTIFEYSLYKKNGKLKKLVLTGCLADMNQKELQKEFKEVDEVVRVTEISDLLKKWNDKKYSYTNKPNRYLFTPKSQAYLKIAEGCSQSCAFCTIPSFKGPYTSFPLEQVIFEAKELAKSGIKEINLVAQDLTAYGRENNTNLSELLKKLCKIEDLKWIRLLYTYPDRIDDELISVMAGEEKICSYIDIPLQHLDNEVLKRMRRWGSFEKYRDLVFQLRDKIPDIAVRTTFIVGFPGETEEEFSHLLHRAMEIKFDRLGVFEYSDEEGTTAYALSGKVDEDTARERYDEMMTAQMEVSASLLEKRVGSQCEVLVEDITEDGLRVCRSQYEAPEVDGNIFVANSKAEIGDFITVKIQELFEASAYDLSGVTL